MTAKPPTESQLMKAFKVLANQKKPENTSFRYFSGVKTVDPVEHVTIPKALYDEWVAAQDEALNWADANARWFDISTAPKDGTLVMFHVPSRTNPLIGRADDYWAGAYWLADVTHWTHLPPPPSNPPLPEPLEALGAVLRRVKNV